MIRRSSIVTASVLASVLALALVACSKKKDKDPAPATGSGSAAMAGSGSGSAAGSDSGSGSAGSAGSGSDAGSAAGSGSDAGSAGSAAAGSGDTPVDFEKLSHDDKVKFMKAKVMPPMRAAFQKFKPKEFANFTCKTCHGKDPQKSKHEMPTPDLPKLDWAAIKKGEEKEWVEFMEETVEPDMAKILGKKEMSKDNPDGFGCLSCHTEKKK